MIDKRAVILACAADLAESYLVQGDMHQAFAAYITELKAHDDTRSHPGIMLGMTMLMADLLTSEADMREFLRGFH